MYCISIDLWTTSVTTATKISKSFYAIIDRHSGGDIVLTLHCARLKCNIETFGRIFLRPLAMHSIRVGRWQSNGGRQLSGGLRIKTYGSLELLRKTVCSHYVIHPLRAVDAAYPLDCATTSSFHYPSKHVSVWSHNILV